MSRFARLVNATPSPSKLDSPSTESSPTKEDRQAISDSLSTGQPPPLPVDRPTTVDGPSVEDSPSTSDSQNILAMIPKVAGHTTLPHAYTDHLARWLSADEQAVYVQLYRLSWGWGKDTCFISNRRLSERSGVPETSMRRAVRKLIAKQLIVKTNIVFGSNTEQGIEYKLSPLDRLTKMDRASSVDGPSNVAPNKEKLLKENSLKGVDASRCPDCMGTGFYYPEGTAKGVKRCEHRRL
jgi:Bacteriophage replication protein O